MEVGRTWMWVAPINGPGSQTGWKSGNESSTSIHHPSFLTGKVLWPAASCSCHQHVPSSKCEPLWTLPPLCCLSQAFCHTTWRAANTRGTGVDRHCRILGQTRTVYEWSSQSAGQYALATLSVSWVLISLLEHRSVGGWFLCSLVSHTQQGICWILPHTCSRNPELLSNFNFKGAVSLWKVQLPLKKEAPSLGRHLLRC